MDTTPLTPTSSPRNYNGQTSLDRVLSWSHSDVWIWAINNGVYSPNPIAFRKHFEVLIHKYGWLFWSCSGAAPTHATGEDDDGEDDDLVESPRPIKCVQRFADPNHLFSPRDGATLPRECLWAMPTHRVRDDDVTVLCESYADKWPVRREFIDRLDLKHRKSNRDVIVLTQTDSMPPAVFRRMVIREIWDNAGLFASVAVTKRGQSNDKRQQRKSSLFGSLRKARPHRRRPVTKTLTLYLTSSLSSSSSSVESC